MHPRDRAAGILVILTLAFGVLAVGSIPRWAACVSALMGVLCATPYVTSRRALTSPGPLLVLLAAALAITLVQWVPLPFGALRFLSPAKAALLDANAAALGSSDVAFASLSYDPPATLVEIARLIGYLGLAYAALRVSHSARGRLLLAYGVAGTGVLVVLVVLAHRAAGARTLYGIYEPRFAHFEQLAPLLNPNHLAGYLGLIAPVCVALAVVSGATQRLAWGGAAILTAAAALMTGSRAGAAALCVGLAITALSLWAQRRRGAERRGSSTVISVAVIIACVVVLLGAVAGREAWNEISNTRADELTGNAGKVAAWRASLPLVQEHWLTGLGRGGFETAFTRAHGQPGEIFSHVENEYLQAVLDWGVPLAALLGVLLIVAVRRGALRWAAGPIESGCAGALVGIALHDTLDFSLAFAGVAGPAIVLLAILVRGSLASQSRSRRRLRLGRYGALAAAGLAIAAAASPAAGGAREDGDELVAIARAGEVALEDALDAWNRHPADHLAAGYTAQALHRRRDRRAASVIARALELHPRHPDLHLLAARILLASQRPTQSVVEYRLALRYTWTRVEWDQLLNEIIRRFPDPALAVRGLPEDPVLFKQVMAGLKALKQQELALLYARRVVEFHPDMPEAWQEISRLARDQGDRDLALTAAERAASAAPESGSVLALASALLEKGRTDDAIRALERAIAEGYPPSATVGDVELLCALARADILAGRIGEAREALLKALGLAGTISTRLAAVHTEMAALELKEGNRERARWHREQAKALSGK
jgi:tetratricopeptide (TPR) repeat protein